jgi:hypothetical protein
MQVDNNMLVPSGAWQGWPSELEFDQVLWMKDLPAQCHLSLWLRWPDQNGVDLPGDADFYLVSFHLEAVDYDWLEKQAEKIKKPIIVLFDGLFHDWPFPANVYPFTYIYWHYQIKKICEWFPKISCNQNKKYLASAFCSRITQSKLIIFTALAEYLGTDHCLLSLSDYYLEMKNIHNKEYTNNIVLDSLSDIFWQKYWGKNFSIDNYSQSLNFQKFTANPWTPAYQNAALHFTNESYHYSLMSDSVTGKSYIRPGPFLTEKTLKCLVGGTAFIPIGQFDTYGSLSRLGFKFDYGFDITWDNDPGNLTRLESIVNLIKSFYGMTAEDLYSITQGSSEHNQELAMSDKLFQSCEHQNQNTIESILKKFS